MQLDVIQNEQCAATKSVVSNAIVNKNLNMAMDTHVLKIWIYLLFHQVNHTYIQKILRSLKN